MHKVYLLLRSNQQSGPHSLEELIAFNLKPSDLVWIEGKSAGWYYPQEIQALHPYLSFLAPKAETPEKAVANPASSSASTKARRVFVTMPNAAGTQPVQAQPAPVAPLNASLIGVPGQQEELKTTYAKSLAETETDYMNWVYQKKQKQSSGFSKKTVLALCLSGISAVAGWHFLKSGHRETPTAVVQMPAQTSVPESAEELPTAQRIDATPAVGKKKVVAKPTALQKTSERVEKPAEQKEAITASVPVINNATAPVIEEPAAASDDAASEPVATETPKEKKKLRDKILDLFKKKPEVAKPVENNGSERQSTRRETGSNLTQLVSVRFTIPNDWMMGIKGAKATLTNRSGETVATALVEVVYYNDDNEVLAKRTIQFNNIKSKGTATAAIPDHNTATRLEYIVISATGLGEPLASR